MEDKKVLNNIETVFEVEFDSDREAEIVYNAIYPELSFSHNDRSTTDIKLDNNNMIITINSKDVVSLRASINSYIRWIKLSTEILNI